MRVLTFCWTPLLRSKSRLYVMFAFHCFSLRPDSQTPLSSSLGPPILFHVLQIKLMPTKTTTMPSFSQKKTSTLPEKPMMPWPSMLSPIWVPWVRSKPRSRSTGCGRSSEALLHNGWISPVKRWGFSQFNQAKVAFFVEFGLLLAAFLVS